MKLSARGRRFLDTPEQGESHFLEDLEKSLVEEAKALHISPSQFERIYKQKNLVSETIDGYQMKNKSIKEDIIKAQQRISQIAQLTDKANKQSILMRNQIGKINEAHMMSKILMMQKIVRLGVENETMQQKRVQCFRVREGKERANSIGRMMFQKKQRVREKSLSETKAMRSFLSETKNQTIDENRSRADRIRSEKERRRQRLLRYEKFKQEQAKKNYLSKTENLLQNLKQKEKLLDTMFVEEAKEAKHFETTEEVTKQYLENILPVSDRSREESSVFPTETI